MAAKLALVATLFGGSLFAQPPQPGAFKLSVPPGYRQRTPAPTEQAPARPKGTINPQAARDPIVTPGRVMYFHKPADARAVDAGPDVQPVEALAMADAGVVPSVLPALMTTQDERLAQAPATPRYSNEYQPPAMPAGARAEAPAYLPVATPAQPTSVPLPAPTAEPSVDQQTLALYSSQKQDLGKPREKTDRSAATRLPARDKIFVIYDDTQLEAAIVASVRDDVKRMMKGEDRKLPPGSEELYRFPELARLVPEGTVYQSKTGQYPPRTECFEPNWVVHRRLHFEQKNPERGGWDLGIAQPVVSTLVFYKDVLFWPHNLASSIHTCWDTNAGKCLPGSPTPFYLYPPEFTVTGSLAEAGLITATVFIFP